MKELKNRLNSLKAIWLYSDAQPTEITLALCLSVLVFPVTALELGFMPIIQGFAFFAGVFQLYCVSREDLKCRLRAALLSLSAFGTIFITYALNGFLTSSPTHFGWLLLLVSAWGSLKRLNREYLHRSK